MKATLILRCIRIAQPWPEYSNLSGNRIVLCSDLAHGRIFYNILVGEKERFTWIRENVQVYLHGLSFFVERWIEHSRKGEIPEPKGVADSCKSLQGKMKDVIPFTIYDKVLCYI